MKATLSPIELLFVKQNGGNDKVAESLIADIIRKYKGFKKERILALPEITEGIPVAYKRTGILGIDNTIGGIPNGITQIYGWEDTFKTTLLLTLAASPQWGNCLFINSDNKPIRSDIPGLPGDLILSTGTKRSNTIANVLISEGLVNNVFIDSIVSLTRYDNFLRSIIKIRPDYPAMSIVMSNQTRMSRYEKTVAYGIDYIHSICSMIIRVEKVEEYTRGHKIHLLVEKPSHERARFYINTNEKGLIDNRLYLFDMGIASGSIIRNGAFYSALGGPNREASAILEDDFMYSIWKEERDNARIEKSLIAKDYII